MAEEIICIYSGIIAKRDEQVKRRRLLKQLRDCNDPFSMQESLFIKTFRIPRSLCRDLIQQLEVHDTHKSVLPFPIRFLSALYFYAHGSYQKCIGNNYTIPLSQSSVSRSLEFITKLIIKVKGNEIRFPKTVQEQTGVKAGFHRMYGIKGTIGAIDCTHIAIVSPSATDVNNPLSLYMNRKGYYSINVEAVCDHILRFTAINAKFPGSCHDSGIWTTSAVRIHLIRTYDLQIDSWLLGDSGYPLEPWLLTPVAEPSNRQEENFNKLHAKGRNTVERAFGVLKSRFRCLLRHRTLHYSHEKAASITYACAILHNVLINHGISLDAEEMYTEVVEPPVQHNLNNLGNYREGQRIRSRYISSLRE